MASEENETIGSLSPLWDDEIWSDVKFQGDDDFRPLSWRMDPDESLSDYTIVIHRCTNGCTAERPDDTTDTYHVHKVVLAVGPRKSKYFERLFKSDLSFHESTSRTSHIHLHPSAAGTFPILLDYLYYQSYCLKIDSFTAPALHFLSDYFDVRQMRREIVVFCQFDLSPSNCHMYYTHAEALNNVAMLRAVRRLCTHQSLKVSRNREMFLVTPAEFWLEVLNEKCKCPGASGDSSGLLEALLQTKASDGRQGLSFDLLEELTDACRLPNIETVGAAMAILSWDDFFRRQCMQQCRRKSHLLADDNAPKCSPLQLRCVEALARILALETPLDVRAVLQVHVLTAIRRLNGALLPLIVSQMVEVIDAQVSQVLENRAASAVRREETGTAEDDEHAAEQPAVGGNGKRKRCDEPLDSLP